MGLYRKIEALEARVKQLELLNREPVGFKIVKVLPNIDWDVTPQMRVTEVIEKFTIGGKPLPLLPSEEPIVVEVK